MQECLSCRAQFKDFKELAIHIATSKTGHAKGKKWAARYLLKVKYLDSKKDKPLRGILTDQEKQNKQACKDEISGKLDMVTTICPLCNQRALQSLPVEYTVCPQVWKVKGMFVIYCEYCRK